MKRQWSIFAIVLWSVGSVHGFNILMEGYTLENYASYSDSTYARRIEFDGSGNLYLNHPDAGKINKIDSAKQVSTFATGLGNTYDMVWGGGTSYGNYLYVSTLSSTGFSDKILKIGLNGNVTTFANMSPPNHGPCAMDIDKTGNYGNQLYAGTASKDRIMRVDASGNISVFTTWPEWTDGGGVYGLAFDTTGNYNGKMYVANMFGSGDADISGLFMVNPNGTVSRFSSNLVASVMVDIDPIGTYFNHDMFAIGMTSFGGTNTLWRVSANGVAEEFMRNVNSFAFGNDGAMYVSTYNWGTQVVSVARVVPEPASAILLGAGMVLFRLRRKGRGN